VVPGSPRSSRIGIRLTSQFSPGITQQYAPTTAGWHYGRC
jgi:hypothetical protein